MSRFVLVRLYAGDTPKGHQQVPDGETARELRDEYFDNYALPYYVILQKEGDHTNILSFYDKGAINSHDEFAAFLETALKRNNEQVAGR